MKNIGMGHDPRAIANALLDLADDQACALSNLSLNKLIFFIHSDSIVKKSKRLSSLTFEAWQYGPVLPIIYHQFKVHGSNRITSRATKIDPKSGDSITVSYSEILPDIDFIRSRFLEYIQLSASALVSLSHEPGGAWDRVWNGAVENVGMKITDDLILSYSSDPAMSGNVSYVRSH